MKRLLIVGGGISGLAAAWQARASGAALEITVLEQDSRLGGKILTEQHGGCILEAGADGILSRKPAGVRLCAELGISERFQAQVPRLKRSFIKRGHELFPLPEGFSGLVPTDEQALRESPLLTEDGRRRAFQERQIPADPGAVEESVAGFMRRRFGPEIFQSLMEPLLSGIFAGDAECLSLQATFPHLRELEMRYGSVTQGLASQSRPAAAGSLPPFVSFPHGMGELVDSLAARLTELGVQVKTETRVTGLKPVDHGYSVEAAAGESFHADALVLAVPAAPASTLLGGIDAGLGSLHAGIPSASTAVVHVAYRRSDMTQEIDGYGYVIPRVEGGSILACTWTSSKWPGRSPADIVLLRLYAGRYGGPDVLGAADAELVAMARQELADTMAITAEPVFTRVFRWPSALPQYILDHPRRLEAIENRLRVFGGLHLAGAAYHGVGIPDCIESGFQAARAAMEHMR